MLQVSDKLGSSDLREARWGRMLKARRRHPEDPAPIPAMRQIKCDTTSIGI